MDSHIEIHAQTIKGILFYDVHFNDSEFRICYLTENYVQWVNERSIQMIKNREECPDPDKRKSSIGNRTHTILFLQWWNYVFFTID